jgi:hypothetical protein
VDDPLPWFCQGDVLRSVPILTAVLNQASDVDVRIMRGPAVLLTHGCALDKANRRGRPTAKRLHFAPLVAVSVQDPGKQSVLRAAQLTPYEVMYLGECGEFGESFIVLSEVYSLPIEFFSPTVRAWEEHPAAIEGDAYLTPEKNGDRVGRLNEQQVALLLNKMTAYWTRRLPTESQTLTGRAHGWWKALLRLLKVQQQ